MSRKLKTLNRMLSDKLGEMHLFGRAEQRGPILHVHLDLLRGSEVDTEQLRETMQAVVQASLLEGIRKVTISAWVRGQTSEEPEWTLSFDYAPLALETVTPATAALLRQDYPTIRVIFFSLAVISGSLYLILDRQWISLLPGVLSLSLGILFPWIKRRINGWVAPLFRRIGLGLGLGVMALALYLIWMTRLEQILITLPLLLVGFLLLGLGL